jgi:hypothetical protein
MVMTALTSGANTSSGAIVGMGVGGSVGGKAVAEGAAVAGASVAAGTAPPHALNTSVSSAIKLISVETFLDMGFFSFL